MAECQPWRGRLENSQGPCGVQPLVAYYCRIINERGIGWCIGGRARQPRIRCHPQRRWALHVCRHPARGQRWGRYVIKVYAKFHRLHTEETLRRSRCGDSGGDIDSAPAIDIVGRSRCAALGGNNMNCRIIQRRSAPVDVVAEVRPGTPQQCHGASDMRCRHRRPAKTHVSVIGGVIAGTSACARRGDIRLDPVTSIDCHRAAAAEGSDVVGACVQCADRVRCRVDSRRIHHSGTAGTVVARSCHHHYPGGSLSFDSSLQRVSRTTF